MSKHAVSSEGQGVVKYNPENNEVVLKNGRVVKYDQLVVATGMDSNYQSIKGFEEAWSEIYEPFFTNQDHSSWKTTCPKTFRYQYNFIGGEAIFYIPPAPFHGELENYNFLLSKAMWDRFAKTGRMSWDTSRLTVINANDSFCPHFEKGDTFLRSELDKHKVNVEHGLKLIEVKHVRFDLCRKPERPSSKTSRLANSPKDPTTASTRSCPPSLSPVLLKPG